MPAKAKGIVPLTQHVEIEMHTFSGPEEIQVYRALVLKHGLYAAYKIRPNRAWTPTAMLKAPYKRGDYSRAIADLHKWLGEKA